MSANFPYPGLRPFARDETDIFFGREEHTDQLLARLDHTHFLAVVGPSGYGKSSLVRTGLMAGLETGFLSSAGARWRVAELRPGNHPFATLTDALLVDRALGPEYLAHITSYFSEPAETTAFLAAGSHRAMLQAQLRRGPFSLHEILAYVPLPQNTRLLIVVDQFEEIFRYYQQGAEDEAAAFVSLLLAGSEHPGVYVVITMRADFLGDCALFHGLPEAINQGLFLTPRLNREQLRAAIEEPAAVFGGKIEPALVNHLLNDAGNNPDQLPVVQHALMRMWTIASAPSSPAGENGKDEGITLMMDHYVHIGGLDAALSQHADEAYSELDPSQHKIAEIMFRRLSERGSDRRDTRRPVPLSEVAAVAKVPWQEVAAVVEVFRQEGRSFLTPPVGRDLEPASVLDISHESLIRQWQRLQDWTIQEAEAAELYQRLEDSASRWEKGQVALWRTPELENALAWRDKVTPTAEWAKRYGPHFDLAMRFLDASGAEQRREEQQAEATRQRELQQARRQKVLLRQVILLGLGLLVGCGLTLWAISAQRQAERSEKLALSALSQNVNLVEGFVAILNSKRVKDLPGFQPVRQELLEVALAYYSQFLLERGDDPSARTWLWYNMGTGFHALGQLEEAIAAYRKQLEITPDHEHAWNGLGDALSDQGKLEEAIAAYQHQVEVRPAHERAWINLGVALYKQGKIDDARAAFQTQVHVRSDPADAWNQIGVVLWEQGWNDEAAAAFASGLAVQPRHLSLLSNDAELALAQGDITRLQSHVSAALPRVTRKDQKFVILRFLAWLANPTQGWADVMTAISKLDPEVKFTWDFSDTRRVITHLDVSTQLMARHFIDFFEGHIDRPTLQARLAAQ
jgi:tetratricopeptide (TPR) repeat protein